MKKIAIYGKGGIGKSTICCALSLAFAKRGLRVLQVGCDPKADSTLALREGRNLPTVLAMMRERKNAFDLSEVVLTGAGGVFLAEAGGPLPGLGCAGRGIITALEKLAEKGVYETCKPDVVLYDVLGDVVCGGFSMPMRSGYADEVYIVTSGENMSIYAAANIATALQNFAKRGYASLGGFILNRRNVEREQEKVQELCRDFDSRIVGDLPLSERIREADAARLSFMVTAKESAEAAAIRKLSREILP